MECKQVYWTKSINHVMDHSPPTKNGGKKRSQDPLTQSSGILCSPAKKNKIDFEIDDFLETEQTIINEENVLSLIDTAFYMSMQKLKDECENYIDQHFSINEKNWKELFNYSIGYRLEKIQNKVMAFVLKNKNIDFWNSERTDVLILNLDKLKFSRKKINNICNLFPNLLQLSFNNTSIEEDYLIFLAQLKKLQIVYLKRCRHIKSDSEKIINNQRKNKVNVILR